MITIEVFGGVRIRLDGVDVTPPGRIPSCLLAALTSDARHPTAVTALIDAAWGEHPPATVESALRTHLSVLRRALGGGLEATGRAYRLTDPGSVDLVAYDDLVVAARTAAEHSTQRFAALTDALDRWTGRPWGDLADAAGLAGRALTLHERHRNLEEEWGELAAGLPTAGPHIDRLWRLALDEPLRERRWVNLIQGLKAADLTGDALRAYEQARDALAGGLGAVPGPKLRSAYDDLFADHGRTRPAPTRPRIVASGPIVGRQAEIRQITERLSEGLTVTLVGIGGMGKTRIATEIVDSCGRRGERAWMLVAPPADLAHRLGRELAAQVGIAAPTEPDAFDALIARLVEVDLLVIDGADTCADGVATLVATIGARRPACRRLLTAREPLGTAGECSVPIGPLSVPTAEEPWVGTALELLIRARGVDPDATPRLLDELLSDCRTTGGVPLLVELAGHSGPSVAGTGSDVERIDLTALELVDTLEGPTQRIARAMAVLPGGLDAELAARIISSTARDADRRLRYLHWLGLTRTTGVGRGATQVMLDPIREALQRSQPPSVAVEARATLVDHLLDIGAATRPTLGSPPDLSKFTRFEAVAINLRSVLDTKDERWLDVAAGAADFLGCRGFSGEGPVWMADALEDPDEMVRATAAVTAARIGRLGGNVVALAEPLHEAIEVFRSRGDADGFAVASVFTALARLFQGRIDEAQLLLTATRSHEPPCSSLLLDVIDLTDAFVTLALGDTVTATGRIEVLAERLESIDLVAASLAHYLLVTSAQGDPDRARAYVPAALRVADTIGDAPMAAAVRLLDASMMGTVPAAVEPLRSAAAALDAAGMPERAAIARVQAGTILAESGAVDDARRELLDALGPLERLESASARVALALLAASFVDVDDELARSFAAACREREATHHNGYADRRLVQLRVDQLLVAIRPGADPVGSSDDSLSDLLSMARDWS